MFGSRSVSHFRGYTLTGLSRECQVGGICGITLAQAVHLVRKRTQLLAMPRMIASD
jgi:hypothetical protein